MDWHSSVRTDHKTLNNEAHECEKYFFIRDLIGTCFIEIFTVSSSTEGFTIKNNNTTTNNNINNNNKEFI